MATSFVQRKIEIAVKLAQRTGGNQPATFAGTGSDTVTLRDHRCSVRISNSGGQAGSRASISVWGMTPSLMNQLSTLGMVIQQVPQNTLTVAAGDDASGMSTRFVGTITDAYGDYNAAPDVPFIFECLAGAAENVIPFPASSYPGAADVATILSAIAQRAGWGFENSGVNVVLSRPYLAGSALDQVRRVAEAARINAQLVVGAGQSSAGPGNVLAIWPRYGTRSALGVPLLAPKPNGQMISYPSYTQQGIMVKNLFDPRLAMGGQFRLETSLPQTSKSGIWNIFKLDEALDALLPKGHWMSTVYGYNPQFPAPIPPKV
jgi:hypothetical protein